MQWIKKDGVSLAYDEINHIGTPQNVSTMVFVHGWGCDHTAFTPQARFFSHSHRVVSVDLRGHGKSDAPEQEYTMATYADDLAWLCLELRLNKPVIVGHSMGGNVALELAARYPQIPASIIMVDSVIFPGLELRATLQLALAGLCGADYVSVCQNALHTVCLPTDDPEKTQVLSSLPRAPQHVLTSAFRNHLLDYDPTSAAAGCHAPIAYVSAAIPLADLAQFRSLTPQLVTAQTLGAGHFSQLFVPDQINAMITRFVAAYSSGTKESSNSSGN
jgi:pimeloyl-ACP methyl ester carboxylesterase